MVTPRLLKVLLTAVGIEVNKAFVNGVTPLLAASKSGHTEVVKLLLVSGANVNQADNNGVTPLLSASCRWSY